MNMSIKAWNDEQEAELTRLYLEEEIKDVHELASIFEKGYRSVISKLVQLKIYEKPELDEEDKPERKRLSALCVVRAMLWGVPISHQSWAPNRGIQICRC